MEGLVTFSIPADREELLSQDTEGCFAIRNDINIANMSPVNLATTIDGTWSVPGDPTPTRS